MDSGGIGNENLWKILKKITEKNTVQNKNIKMLVCIIKRSKQEAIYLLKIVFTQSSEFNFICKLHNTLYDSVVPLTYNDEQ